MAFDMRQEEAIDRVAPTRRPPERSVMRQNWHHLLFLHWVVPAEQLRPFLPLGLDVDMFEGRAYIGLVPFTMTGVRPIWSPPIRSISDFHETNVRTYVHRRGHDPGVWFFSLDAANSLAVRVARRFWRLPYYYARMRLTIEKTDTVIDGKPTGVPAPAIDYTSERCWPPPIPATCAVRYTPQGPVSPAVAGTLEHFLVERYFLYAYKDGRLYRGQVRHQPYPLQTATVHALEESMVSAAGIHRPQEPPLMHYAREVNVEIFPLKRVNP